MSKLKKFLDPSGRVCYSKFYVTLYNEYLFRVEGNGTVNIATESVSSIYSKNTYI